MNKSVKDYKEYITDHILNVKKAFQIYGFMLCDELEVDFYEMQNQIDNHDKSKWSAEEFDPYMKKFFPDGPVITDYELIKHGYIIYNIIHIIQSIGCFMIMILIKLQYMICQILT